MAKMTIKKGNKKIEFEVKEEILEKWDNVAKILGFSRAKFIRNAVDKYIINIFEAIKPIYEIKENINENLKSNNFPTMICPSCKKEIDKRGSVQHIKACKKVNESKDVINENISKENHDPKIISKEKRDRLKLEKKFNDVGRDGIMKERIL